jgi:hypothetical protein
MKIETNTQRPLANEAIEIRDKIRIGESVMPGAEAQRVRKLEDVLLVADIYVRVFDDGPMDDRISAATEYLEALVNAVNAVGADEIARIRKERLGR